LRTEPHCRCGLQLGRTEPLESGLAGEIADRLSARFFAFANVRRWAYGAQLGGLAGSSLSGRANRCRASAAGKMSRRSIYRLFDRRAIRLANLGSNSFAVNLPQNSGDFGHHLRNTILNVTNRGRISARNHAPILPTSSATCCCSPRQQREPDEIASRGRGQRPTELLANFTNLICCLAKTQNR
jgi:hypothetical protein